MLFPALWQGKKQAGGKSHLATTTGIAPDITTASLRPDDKKL
ncbi:hypothetical protein [Yersinia pestis]|nr:hypothetical protein [Yersinia pestis]OML03661.1 hypothetical protein BFI37_00455 [Yersinia pestis subsp. microtus bv. Caucasica]